MATFQWTDGDGTRYFNDPYNWRNEYTFGSGVPGSGDDADVDATGTITGAGGQVSGLALYADGGPLTVDELLITATNIGLDYGNIALTNGTNFFVLSQIHEFGETTVTLNDDSFIYVNSTGPSTVGLDIGLEQGTSAVLDLTGFGTRILVREASTELGDTGTAVVTVSGGAELDTEDANNDGSGALTLGSSAGAQGTLTVTGAYSSLQASGLVIVGESGSGYLIVEAGAEASVTQSYGLTIGDQAGSTGTLLVTGTGSRLDACAYSQTTVGNAGTGTLTVASHGFAELESADVGDDGGHGTIAVTGTGSTVEVRDGLVLGGSSLDAIYNPNDGTGVLSVSAGAQAVVADFGIVLGADPDTAGTISVWGAHSTLDIGTDMVDVGYYGSGTLIVADGGVVKATGSNEGFLLGFLGGSAGTALVTGAGSDITDTGAFNVGHYGTGTIKIAAGGRVSAASVVTSDFAAAAVSLSGTGSALAVAGLAQFGGTAATAVSIGSGSVLSAATALVQDAGVSLAGGTLSVSKAMTLDAGQKVSGNGTVKAASLINTGTIESAGGTLSFIGKISGPGTLAVGNASTLSLSGAVGSGQTALFDTAAGTLALASPTQFAAAIEAFVHGDVIDLSGIVAKSLTFANGKLTVHETNGSSLGLIFSGAYSTGSFAAPTSDGHGGTLIQHS